jgi:hypothetical protein
MTKLWIAAVRVLIVVGIGIAVSGAEAHRPAPTAPGPFEGPPHGSYECWPAEDAQPGDNGARLYKL